MLNKGVVRLRKVKVGLALGSGVARGLAHIGVLEVLQAAGIPIDMIAGTSAGAIAGGVFARRQDIGPLRGLALGIDLKKMAWLLDPVLPRAGLIGGRKIKNWLGLIMGNGVKFSDLRIPFACVATDVNTGEEVVIREGLVLDGIRASISIPVIFTIISWQDRYLIDGTLVNPVPVSVLKEMGADFIIAVNVTPASLKVAQPTGRRMEKGLKAPNILSAMIQSINIASASLVRSCLEGADIVIQPEVAHIHPGDFHRVQECIELGERAARAAIPEIKRLLAARQTSEN